MIALMTGDIVFFNSLHPYKYTSEYIYDIIVTGDADGKLVYTVVESATSTVITRHILSYKSKSAKLIKQYCPYIYHTDLQLKSVVGFYRIVDTDILTTMFLILYHPIRKSNYVVQYDMKNHAMSSVELFPLGAYLDSKYDFLDVMLRKAAVYTDTKSTTDYDAYLMYTGLDAWGRNCVNGIRVLVTEEEKEEFASHNNISFVETDYPITDQYSTTHFKFYDIPKGTTEMSFNFSTGMSILRFED